MKTVVAIDHQFDETTLAEIEHLRQTRLTLARRQLAASAATVDELIKRGLLPDGDRKAYQLELQYELKLKIADLEQRAAAAHVVHFDEIELYVNVVDGVQSAN